MRIIIILLFSIISLFVLAQELLQEIVINEFNLSWNEEEKSPCIDTGDPDPQYNDPDGTHNDMGAYYHPHEVKTYEFPSYWTIPDVGWKWLCFDILDKRIAYNTVDPLLVPIQDDFITGECYVLGSGAYIEFYYDDPDWINPDHEITSPQGYKFQTLNACSFDISGFRCEATTTFQVLAEMPRGNCIGYYLSRSQHVYYAFYGYLDNIYAIKALHWSVKYDNG
ncbi:MAG: hypothetical protein KAU01_04365 [Candidatus Cloacimonetes bacterium]|nr:hypothetical protein [Candidatus Cloacimonadota bacterium]